MLLEDGEARRRQNKRELVDARLSNAAKCCWKTKVTKRDHVVSSTRHHRARLLKYYPRRPCAPSFVKSRMLRPLQTRFLLFQQIFFVLVCIHPGTPRVPPRVLASGPKPSGAKNYCVNSHRKSLLRIFLLMFFTDHPVWTLHIDFSRYIYQFKVARTSFQHFSRRTFWGVIITLYQIG